MGRELCRNYALWQGEWENEVEINGLSAWQSRHAGALFRAVLRKTQNTCIRSSTSFPFGPTTVGWSPKIEDAAWCVFSPPSLPQVGTALGRAFVMILKKDAVFSLEKGAKLQLRTDQKVLPRAGTVLGRVLVVAFAKWWGESETRGWAGQSLAPAGTKFQGGNFEQGWISGFD